MRLSKSKSKNAISYYMIDDVKVGGKRKTVIIENLGTDQELREKYPGQDPEAVCRAYIAQVNQDLKEGRLTISHTFSNHKQLERDKLQHHRGGYLFLQSIYHELGLPAIAKGIQQKSRFKYSLDEILSRLVYTRVLFPGSKRSSLASAKKFLEPPSYTLEQSYRALDVLAAYSDEIQAAVYKQSRLVLPRNDKVLYYDCTNFYFEIEQEDDFRKYGVSKENRPNPIVQMGLFMDGNGMPLAFEIFPGNQSEQTSLKPAEKRIIRDFELSRFVLCSDAGVASTENRLFNTLGGRAYVVTQSIKKLKSFLKEWALDPLGWKLEGSQKTYDLREVPDLDDPASQRIYYKERWIKEDDLEQRLIVTFSPRYRLYQQTLRARQLTRAMKSLDKKKAKRANDPMRFIQETYVTPDGEVADKSVRTLDEKAIEQEAIFDGLYGLATNLEDPIREILTITKRRWEIEETFRLMKTDFDARPIHLSREERIRAHFLTCFLALLVYRVLEKKLDEKYTCPEIIETLCEMNFFDLASKGFVPTYTRTALTDDLHEAFGFRTDLEILDNQMMRNIFKQTKKKRKITQK